MRSGVMTRFVVVLVVCCALCAHHVAGKSDTEGSQVTDLSEIPTLEHSDLKDMLTKTDGVWLVLVGSADCGEGCDLMRKMLNQAQAKAGDIMSFGYIDARGPLVNDKGEETVVALEMNITEVPSMLYYAYGPKKVVPSHTISPQVLQHLIGRGLKPFLKFLRNFLPSNVGKVTNLSLKKFFTFETPELQRVLLVSKKKKSPLPYDRLSLQFHRRAVFGYASPKDEELLTKFGLDVDEVPALFVSPKGGEPLDPTAESFEWTRYTKGDMSYHTLSAWLHEQTERVPVPLINDEAVYTQHCKDKGGVCFIAFLPDEDWETGVELFRRVAERVYVAPNIVNGKFTTVPLPLQFAWAQADHQPAVAKAFDLDNAPGLVAVNAKKGVYGTYLGAFSELDVHGFVVDTMNLQVDLREFGNFMPPFRSVAAPLTKAQQREARKKRKKRKKDKKKFRKNRSKKDKRGKKKKSKKKSSEAEL